MSTYSQRYNSSTDTSTAGSFYFYVYSGTDYSAGKLLFGPDDASAPIHVSSANPLPVTISGVATSGKQDTGNTSLSSIDGKVPALGQALAAASVPVVLTAAQLSTLTPLSTITSITNVVHVDDNSGSLTVDYATTGSGTATGALRVELANNGTGVLATLGTITNVVHVDDNSGSLTVDYATTGSGTAIGALRVELANNGTGVLATLGTITNVVHVDDNSGSLTVDYATTGSGTATGALRVELANNGTGTLATLTTCTTVTTVSNVTGGTTAHDGAGGSINPLAVGLYASAAAPSDVSADNDIVRAWALRNGAQCIQTTYAGVLATTGNGVSGTGVPRVTIASDSTGQVALAAGTNGIGKLTSNSGVTIGAVEIASAQTLATVTTVSTVTTCSTVTTLTGGAVAHDGADSGNPIKVGAKCSLTLSDDTIVSNADRTDLTSDGDGTILIRPQMPLADLVSERITNTDGASTAFSNFGQTANTRNYVTAISAYNSSATGGYIDFRDGTSGSVLFTVAIPAGGGVAIACEIPFFKTTANTALAYDVSAALSTVYLSISGFRSKVV